MKKILSILFVLIAALIIWLYLAKQTSQQSLTVEPTNAVIERQPSQHQTSLAGVSSNIVPVQAMQQPTNIIESISKPINALAATNLDQWKSAINGLKPLAGFTVEQHWLVEQPGRTNGIPIVLSQGNKTVQYNAVLISVNAQNENGQITKVEMQSSNMNIDETRDLGLRLCNMLGRDPTDFLAWCDKVGNHWLDSTLFSSGGSRMPNSDKFDGFGILHTYNNDKPWMINFFITPP